MKRPMIRSVVRLTAEHGEAPNKYVGFATAEVRLAYPPQGRAEAAEALRKAVADAWKQFEEADAS